MKRTPLRPSAKPLARKTPLRRDTPLRSVNPERKAREFARAYGSEARVRRLKRMKCAVPFCTRWTCDNAHLEREGMSRKGHWSTVVPLCSGGDGHHRMLDVDYGGDVERFDAALGSDLWGLAGRLAEEVEP